MLLNLKFEKKEVKGMDDIMVYSPNIWSTGQAITVAKMNRIEEALEYAVTYVNAYRNNADNISN